MLQCLKKSMTIASNVHEAELSFTLLVELLDKFLYFFAYNDDVVCITGIFFHRKFFHVFLYFFVCFFTPFHLYVEWNSVLLFWLNCWINFFFFALKVLHCRVIFFWRFRLEFTFNFGNNGEHVFLADLRHVSVWIK